MYLQSPMRVPISAGWSPVYDIRGQYLRGSIYHKLGATVHHVAVKPWPDPAKFIILNTKFFVFNTQRLVFNTKFIIFTHGAPSSGWPAAAGAPGVLSPQATCQRAAQQPLRRRRTPQAQPHAAGLCVL